MSILENAVPNDDIQSQSSMLSLSTFPVIQGFRCNFMYLVHSGLSFKSTSPLSTILVDPVLPVLCKNVVARHTITPQQNIGSLSLNTGI